MAGLDLVDNVFLTRYINRLSRWHHRWESEGKETIKESLIYVIHNQIKAHRSSS